MIKRTIVAFVLIHFISMHVNAQNDGKNWHPSFDISYSFGGNFYLNYLESNPMWTAEFGIEKAIDQKAHLGIRLGYEGLEMLSFLPITARYKYGHKKVDYYLYAGYAFGIYNGIKSFEEYAFEGGLALGLGIDYSLIQTNNYTLLLNIGYDHRNSTLDFSTTSSGNSVTARSLYHFLTLGVGLRL